MVHGRFIHVQQLLAWNPSPRFAFQTHDSVGCSHSTGWNFGIDTSRLNRCYCNPDLLPWAAPNTSFQACAIKTCWRTHGFLVAFLRVRCAALQVSPQARARVGALILLYITVERLDTWRSVPMPNCANAEWTPWDVRENLGVIRFWSGSLRLVGRYTVPSGYQPS